MDANERRVLFQQMIAANIRQYTNGLTELPLDEVRHYCDVIGLGSDDDYRLDFCLFGGKKEYYNFVVGAGTDYMALVELMDVFYWDVEEHKLEAIDGGRILYGALYRDFYSGVDFICGHMSVDRFGNLYVEVMHSDDIVAIFRISLSADNIGIQLIRTDDEGIFRIWSDGDTLFIAPAMVFITDGSPL